MTHYFESQEGAYEEASIRFSARGRSFVAKGASGIFSKDSLDNATKLLVESATLVGAESVLDLGCGWGPVGLVLKSCYPAISLTMVDSNDRAVKVARKNFEVAGLEADIKRSNVFSRIDDVRFDVILTNPPYAAGRKVCYQFIEESFDHLRVNGVFFLVARHQKGGKMLEAKIEEVFGSVETVAKQGGFRVYKGIRE